MTAADVAACLAAVDLLEQGDELVQRLWANARLMQSGLQAMGYDTGHSATPIIPVMLGEAALAQAFSRALFAAGVFAMAITYPTVPAGKARIRVMNSAAHSTADLEEALSIFQRVGRQLGVIA
jgi:glycine C-acetyltransferase